jgi:hypothetical protein
MIIQLQLRNDQNWPKYKISYKKATIQHNNKKIIQLGLV